MKYFDGKEVFVGDKVKMWDGCYGVVVCSIDSGDYTSSFPESEWGYLKTGVVINSEQAGILHYTESDEDFELIVRGESIHTDNDDHFEKYPDWPKPSDPISPSPEKKQ